LLQEKIPIQLKLGRSEQTLNWCDVTSFIGALALVSGFRGNIIHEVQQAQLKKIKKNNSWDEERRQ
jgi:hypothetical protein